MSGIKFDSTISLGHVITILGVIIAIGGGWYTFDYRLKAIEGQMQESRTEVRNLSTVIVENARMDERVADLRRRVDNLERR